MQGCDERALFVEDDADTADVVSTILKYAGGKTIIASTASQTMELLVGPRFGFILVEWSLEGGFGPELCHKLKAYDGDTPVFLYTGNTFHPDLKKVAEAGAEGYVESPLGAAELPFHVKFKRLHDRISG